MNLRTLTTCAAVVLLAAAAAGADQAPACANGQSPRNVDRRADPSPYQLTGHTSFIGRTEPGSLVYLPRPGGEPQTLYRCGQHYHFPIETPQGCRGETPEASTKAASTKAAPPPPGSRIEIHTVYAANRAAPPGCDPETLGCCTDPPFLVRAFSATVSERGEGPIEPPAGRPLAEWSGSTTGPESAPGECKPPALWSLRLGCGFTVGTAQLEQFKHADPARPVQHGERLSRDLTLVRP